MAREALLVIDMLDDFVREGAPLEVPGTRRIVPFVRNEIERARAAAVPVVYVNDSHAPDDVEFGKYGWPPHAVKGTPGAAVVGELAPREGDHVVEKTTYSGFYGTGLDALLERLGVTDLRLVGCVTHICVMFTASDAVLRGYRVSVPGEGVAGLDAQDHEAALRIMRNVLGVKIL